jgi:hypothetical protein
LLVFKGQRDSGVSPCLERGRILQDQQDFEEIYGRGFKMEVAESLQACWHGRGRVQEPFIFFVSRELRASTRLHPATGFLPLRGEDSRFGEDGPRTAAPATQPYLERGRILQDQQDYEEIYRMGFKIELAESLQACWHGRGRVQEPFIFCLPGAAREYTLAPGYGLFAPSGRRLKIWGRWAADGSPSHTAVS